MYGGGALRKEISAYETDFLSRAAENGFGPEENAKRLIQAARAAYLQKDNASAMREYNRAWLLDPDNGDSYEGFALLSLRAGRSEAEISQYFETAVSKDRHRPEANLNYSNFLANQRLYDKSIRHAQIALERQPSIAGAREQIAYVYERKGDLENACTWGKQAQDNEGTLPADFLSRVCRTRTAGIPPSQSGPQPSGMPGQATAKKIEGMLRGFSISIPRDARVPLSYGYEGKVYARGADAVKAMHEDFKKQIAAVRPPKERFGGQVLVYFPSPDNHPVLKVGRDKHDVRYEDYKPTVLEFARTSDLAIMEALKASKLFDDVKAAYADSVQRDPNAKGFVMRRSAGGFMVSYQGGPEIYLPHSKKTLADWTQMMIPIMKEAKDNAQKTKERSA